MAGVAVLRGIVCPKCGLNKYRVVSRYRPTKNVRVRYFQCLTDGCGERFKTSERLVGRIPREPS